MVGSTALLQAFPVHREMTRRFRVGLDRQPLPHLKPMLVLFGHGNPRGSLHGRPTGHFHAHHEVIGWTPVGVEEPQGLAPEDRRCSRDPRREEALLLGLQVSGTRKWCACR